MPVVSLTPSRLEQVARFEAENNELLLTFHDLAKNLLGRKRNKEEEDDDGNLSEDSLEDVDERFEMEVRRAQRTAEKIPKPEGTRTVFRGEDTCYELSGKYDKLTINIACHHRHPTL